MSRTTQCVAPLAFLFLFATGSAFAGTAAETAAGFAGYMAEQVPGAAPTATEQAGEQQAMQGGATSKKCTPTKTAVHC
jgi:hypothetical protein